MTKPASRPSVRRVGDVVGIGATLAGFMIVFPIAIIPIALIPIFVVVFAIAGALLAGFHIVIGALDART